MKRTILPTLLAAALSTAANAQDSARTGVNDTLFAIAAADSGMAEVALSRLGLEKATSAELKAFSRKMIDEHTKLNQDLASVAGQKRISLPRTVDPRAQFCAQSLAGLSGEQFDRCYAKAQLLAHMEAASAFEAESERGQDLQIRSLATKALPHIKEHLATIKPIAMKLEGAARLNGRPLSLAVHRAPESSLECRASRHEHRSHPRTLSGPAWSRTAPDRSISRLGAGSPGSSLRPSEPRSRGWQAPPPLALQCRDQYKNAKTGKRPLMISGVGKTVLDRLQSSPYLALQEIHCEYREGIVTLRGRLPTHYLKQVAQNLVADVDGVNKIINLIEVRDKSPSKNTSRPDWPS